QHDHPRRGRTAPLADAHDPAHPHLLHLLLVQHFRDEPDFLRQLLSDLRQARRIDVIPRPRCDGPREVLRLGHDHPAPHTLRRRPTLIRRPSVPLAPSTRSKSPPRPSPPAPPAARSRATPARSASESNSPAGPASANPSVMNTATASTTAGALGLNSTVTFV